VKHQRSRGDRSRLSSRSKQTSRGDSRPRLSGRVKPGSRDNESTLDGKVALVTGGNQGIGLAIARAFAAEGCNLIITGRNQTTLNKASKELGRKVSVLAVVCDVGNASKAMALFDQVKTEFGRLDFLINNAGISHSATTVDKLSAEAWESVIGTNLTGMFLVTRAALPLLRRGGAIVNNLSIAAKKVFAGQGAYCASKNGALAMTNTLREELRPQGIRVVALLPGATNTAIWNQFWPDAPRKKMMSPKTVAEAVVKALILPGEGTVEELTILPSAGTL
jgi:NAD(P)-dependent dehydrogenase (short-subunit alcohol dehydrogenase family)